MERPSIVIQSCGPMTSLQDAGRVGSQRFGVSRSGAMDRLALAQANALVGNDPGEAAIEFMLLGGRLRVEGGATRIALAGAPARIAIDEVALPLDMSASLEPGQNLTIGPAQAGIFVYLAIAGGFDLPARLGSLSLQPRAGIGGLENRALRVGDALPLRSDAPSGFDGALPPLTLGAGEPIRVVLGPQADHFDDAAIAAFLANGYGVSAEADRMGYRLAGPAIPHLRGFNIVSDGIVAGSVQVPGSGFPIVMMADHQTTGGYPKIATVISPDLRLLAQRRPGDAVRFSAVDVQEARRLAVERATLVASLASRVRPVRGGLPGVEELLGLNLAGAAADALSPEI